MVLRKLGRGLQEQEGGTFSLRIFQRSDVIEGLGFSAWGLGFRFRVQV